MFEKLDAYLDDIGHFLSGRREREEILSEIRSCLLEKAEREYGAVTDAALAGVIAAHGPARRVAEKYLEGQSFIAPALQRFLFRYTSVLFTIHAIITVIAVVLTKSFLVFPFLLVPQMDVGEALVYLPTAFLFDLGLVTLILHLITRSRREVKLPWPRFAVDLDEVKRPARLFLSVLRFGVLAALTGLALYIFNRNGTLFFAHWDLEACEPFFKPGAGRWLSLAVVVLLAAGAIAAFIKILIASPYVDVVRYGIHLVVFGSLWGFPIEDAIVLTPSAKTLGILKYSLGICLFFITLAAAVDFIKSLIRLGRNRPAQG